jgi:hypothetical protein
MVFASSEGMNQGVRLVKFDGEEVKTLAKAVPPQLESAHFRAVTTSVVQDALNVWADIWGELQESIACGVAVAPEAQKGSEPSCGWPEFLEKMWALRHHLEFLARFSRQG